jgi:hypothetical protein
MVALTVWTQGQLQPQESWKLQFSDSVVPSHLGSSLCLWMVLIHLKELRAQCYGNHVGCSGIVATVVFSLISYVPEPSLPTAFTLIVNMRT